MTKTLKPFLRPRSVLTILVIVAFIYLIINLLRSHPQSKPVSAIRHIKEVVFFLISIFSVLGLQYFLHTRISQLSFLKDRIRLQIIIELMLSVVYTSLICFGVFMILLPVYMHKGSDFRTLILFTMIIFMIQLVYLFYHHLSDYLERFKTLLLKAEKARYEKITAQYKALQNHIGPHFIFNSLTGLDAMVKKEPAIASKIISHLSDLLRHIIITLDKVTIPLAAELEFIERYYALLDIRFPGCIVLQKKIDPLHMAKKIPPCLLQILVENAVKHSIISTEQPLIISITSLSDNRLEVSNNISKRKSFGYLPVTGTGLNNVRQRYALLTEERLDIFQTDERFSVILPLLETDSYEYTDH